MATSQLHEDFSREEHVKAGSDKGFGQVFAGFFAIVAALSWWRGTHTWHYTLPVALVFLVIAYTYPRILAPLNKLWLKSSVANGLERYSSQTWRKSKSL